MANILSLHFGIHDSAAALFDDYRIVAAIQKERLNREKKSGGPPIDCIGEVLAIGGIPPKSGLKSPHDRMSDYSQKQT